MNPTLAIQPRFGTRVYEPIAPDLVEVEKILEKTLGTGKPGVSHLIAHLAHYRGKRLRPALLLLTAHACGQVTGAHHVLGAVVEMIHTATLVHDDVLDTATVRRHVSTINASWGNQASILLGDYLFTHAFHLSSTLGNAEACRIIGAATNRLCAGELHQVVEQGNLSLSEEAYFDIIDGKTAELTSCCCRLGALFSGMDPDIVEHLAQYGRDLGLAFQIADDVLDLVGAERSAGKSLGTDLEQQKMTLPLIRLFSQASADQTSRLRQMLNAPGNHKREKLLPELLASDALAYTQRRAEQLARQAAEHLECLPASECREILERLCQRVVHRDG